MIVVAMETAVEVIAAANSVALNDGRTRDQRGDLQCDGRFNGDHGDDGGGFDGGDGGDDGGVGGRERAVCM